MRETIQKAGIFDRLIPSVRPLFRDFSGHVFITAAGIAIRAVAPLVQDKTVDPAVVSVDEAGRFSISLLSGHLGGGNELARKVADAIGATAVITTATDSRGIAAVDDLARRFQLFVENPEAIKRINSALLEGKRLRVHDPFQIISPHLPLNPCENDPLDVFVEDTTLLDDKKDPLILRPKSLVAGMGCNRNTDAEEMRDLLLSTFDKAGLSLLSLSGIGTIDLKKNEAGLLKLARSLDVPLFFFTRSELAQVPDIPNPSAMAEKHVGVKSVCEAAAILAAKNGDLIVTKENLQKHHSGRGPKKLFIVGLGPGSPDHISMRARMVLGRVETVAGYTTYIQLAKDLLGDARLISTPMKKEKERVAAALEEALSGHSCALISSGDPGIYAMAGLVFEMCRNRDIPVQLAGASDSFENPDALEVEVVPGIPALCAGAALLGAPLTHDFAVISLSDLLTPWEKIKKRLDAAARADFVIVLYNPKSKKRHWQLEAAQGIILKHRPSDTPVGVVQKASREGQAVSTLPLNALHLAHVDMQSIVFIGNKASFLMSGSTMVTPRGYGGKYDLY